MDGWRKKFLGGRGDSRFVIWKSERARELELELEFTIFIGIVLCWFMGDLKVEFCYFSSKKDAVLRFDVVVNCDLLMDGKIRRRAEKCCLSLIV